MILLSKSIGFTIVYSTLRTISCTVYCVYMYCCNVAMIDAPDSKSTLSVWLWLSRIAMVMNWSTWYYNT